MKEMTVNEALQMAKVSGEPAISLYVATNVTEADGVGKIRKNLHRLYKTVESVVAKTHESGKRERLLRPLQKALGALRLSRSKGGIAIYHTERFTGVVKLPTAVHDLAVASDSFHIKPVLRAAQLRRTYHILAFRKKFVDLIQVTADETKLIERINLGINSQRKADDFDQPRRIFRDNLKVKRQRDLKAAMTTLNQQLQAYLHGQRSPLLLAGPHHWQEAFRNVCTYLNLLPRGMEGNVDSLDLHGLGNLSSMVMEPYFAEIDLQSLVAFQRAEASGLGSLNLRQIAEAAARGQVLSLLIADDRQIWGRLDRDSGEVRIVDQRVDAATDDLLDDIAELVLAKGGKVTVLPSSEMPSRQPIAAVLRWSDSYPRLGGRQILPAYRRGSAAAEAGAWA